MKTLLFALLLAIPTHYILAQDTLSVDSASVRVDSIQIDSIPILVDSIKVETLQIDKNMITGRWYETIREVNGKNTTPEHPDFYVFRPTGSFHIGESNKGVILFNKAGRYKINNDTIQANYLHMLNEAKPQYIQFNIKVSKISDTEMDTYMSHKDETPIYVRLKKAGSR